MANTHSFRATTRFQRGISLIESTVATAVVAVAAGTVGPGLMTLRTHQAVIGAAAEFETDVAQVRSLAVASGVTWRISFESVAGESCYVIHPVDSGDCRCLGQPAPVCADGTPAYKRAAFARGTSVTLSANLRSMTFDGVKGTSTPAGTVRFVGRDGSALHQVVNVMGRVRSCSPDRAIKGFKNC
jgi:type IV fimbrial biogenesis protein FimT